MTQPNIKKNYLYRLSYELLILITPFITTPYISRVLGAEGIGIYSYTSSIMTYFTLFAGLGTVTYGTREIARHRDNRKETSKLFWEIELITVLTSSICLLIWGLVILNSKEYRYYYIALTPTLLATMADISWYFTGHEQMKYIVLKNSMCKLLGIILLFVCIKQKEDIVLYAIINSSIQLFGNLSMWTYLPKMLEKVNFKTLTLKKHFQETLVYFIPTIAISIYTVLDKTLIGIMTDDTYQNGYYEQATKIINIIKSLAFASVNTVMGARISYLFASNKIEEIKEKIKISMDFILLMSFGCVFGLCGIAKQFVPWFFGEGYEPVILLLYLMSPLIIIIGISGCLGGQYYTPSGKRKQSAKYVIMGSIANLCFNLILIPKFGAKGATIGSIIAELTITILYVYHSKDFMSAYLLWKLAWKRIIAGTIMIITLNITSKLLPLINLELIIAQIIIGIFIYMITLIILKDAMVTKFLNKGFNKFMNLIKKKEIENGFNS